MEITIRELDSDLWYLNTNRFCKESEIGTRKLFYGSDDCNNIDYKLKPSERTYRVWFKTADGWIYEGLRKGILGDKQ